MTKKIKDQTTFRVSTLAFIVVKVLLEKDWNSKQMITEGEAAIPLETNLQSARLP